MKNASVFVAYLLLVVMVTFRKSEIIFSPAKKLEKIDQELTNILYLYAEKILYAKANLIGKRFFLKNLIKLMRSKQKLIGQTTNKKTGYLHWRMG